TMAGSPALLLLLSLGLCCTTAQQQRNTMEARFLDRNMKHPQQGQRLELECRTSRTTLAAYWFRQDKDGNLHYIATSNSRYNRKFYVYNRISQRFEVSWRDSSPRLVVKSFMAQDQGIYFCINLINQELHFSSGQPAFFPGQCLQLGLSPFPLSFLPAGTSNENTPRFCHDTVIWVNLAGTCLLLLLTAITINIAHCRSKLHPDTLQSFQEPHTTEHRNLHHILHLQIRRYKKALLELHKEIVNGQEMTNCVDDAILMSSYLG
uniref:Ig-like domain-containing protein n=1 Tax=Coturnix japonica TaxID=93934 RepID=A0A8C2T0V1_COTJA